MSCIYGNLLQEPHSHSIIESFMMFLVDNGAIILIQFTSVLLDLCIALVTRRVGTVWDRFEVQ